MSDTRPPSPSLGAAMDPNDPYWDHVSSAARAAESDPNNLSLFDDLAPIPAAQATTAAPAPVVAAVTPSTPPAAVRSPVPAAEFSAPIARADAAPPLYLPDAADVLLPALARASSWETLSPEAQAVLLEAGVQPDAIQTAADCARAAVRAGRHHAQADAVQVRERSGTLVPFLAALYQGHREMRGDGPIARQYFDAALIAVATCALDEDTNRHRAVQRYVAEQVNGPEVTADALQTRASGLLRRAIAAADAEHLDREDRDAAAMNSFIANLATAGALRRAAAALTRAQDVARRSALGSGAVAGGTTWPAAPPTAPARRR